MTIEFNEKNENEKKGKSSVEFRCDNCYKRVCIKEHLTYEKEENKDKYLLSDKLTD